MHGSGEGEGASPLNSPTLVEATLTTKSSLDLPPAPVSNPQHLDRVSEATPNWEQAPHGRVMATASSIIHIPSASSLSEILYNFWSVENSPSCFIALLWAILFYIFRGGKGHYSICSLYHLNHLLYLICKSVFD